ncbi:MAG: hypothetical protein PWQ16_371 [bacterium]|nr:MAG: Uncharacterized protein XD52_1298 [bacterium 42_11]MDK2871019.1 hypothetical protein [bacterium]
MIITKGKPLDEILSELEGLEKIFIVGCSLCATASKTGGEEEVEGMKRKLESFGKKITGSIVLDPVCNLQKSRLDLKRYDSEIKGSDAVLCMACGNGLQTLGEILGDKPVFPANDTLFLGEVKRFGVFEERCLQCGRCLLTSGVAICPLSRCPKGILNGPCGGANDGKCEVAQDLKCVWIEIYEKLKAMGRLGDFRKINYPLDYSIKVRPGQHLVRRGVSSEQA